MRAANGTRAPNERPYEEDGTRAMNGMRVAAPTIGLFHILPQFSRILDFVILHFIGGGAIMTMVFYIMRFYAYAVLSEYLSLRTSPQTGVAIPKIDGDCHVAALLAMTELIILC